MTKATHYGECQLCGKTLKVSNGVISQHGHKGEGNRFTDPCYGSKNPPYEKSCDLIKKEVQELQAQIDVLKNSASNF